MRLIDKEQTAKDIARYKISVLELGNDKVNNMMESYINPSAFLDGVTYGMGLAEKVVNGQPTAYDSDKVVGQLEAELYRGMESLDPVLISFNFGINKAIEIVKSGGKV